MPQFKVALAKGQDRIKNIQKVLTLLSSEIKKDLKSSFDSAQDKKIKKKGYVLIKPNLNTTKRELASTNAEAVDAVIGFLREFYQGEIIIAEGSAIGKTYDGFRNYGYLYLERKYKNIKLFDLNSDEGEEILGVDKTGKTLKLKVAKMVTSAPYKISIAPLKTHDKGMVAMGIENMVSGSLIKGGPRYVTFATKLLLRRHFRDYKAAIIQSYKSFHHNLAKIFPQVAPNLSVIDGFVGMERNGPIGGDPVQMGIALASQDALAADTLAAYLMEFDPARVGYLHLMGSELVKIKVVGEKVENCREKFRPHDSYLEQLKWHQR